MRGILLFLLLAQKIACAQQLPLNELGAPFAYKGQIEWPATNALPMEMNLYKVIPAEFSLNLISNIAVLGGFTNLPKTVNALLPAFRGKDCLFEEEPARKAISVSPKRGQIFFHNTRRIALPRETVTQVPSSDETLSLALLALPRLGLSESQFAKKRDSGELLFWRIKQTNTHKKDGKLVKQETANGLNLVRAIDGISFAGIGNFGGLYLLFGNEGKIAEFELCWRNLRATTKLPVVDRTRITDWIRNGKVFLEPNPDLPSTIDKLVVTNVTPHYFGLSGTDVQKWVYPFLTLEGFAEGAGKKSAIVLCCPASEEH